MNLKKIFENIKKERTAETLFKELKMIVDGVQYEGNRVLYLEESDDDQSYVDLSINNNPYPPETIQVDCNGIVYDVKVYSIFRRFVDEESSDANPLIYALKNENGWCISKKDRDTIYEHLREIAKKIVDDVHQDITIVMPSSNKLNDYFSKEIVKCSNNIKIYKDEFIEKRTTEAVLEDLQSPRSDFFKFYHKKGEKAYREKIREFLGYKKDMDLNHFGYFTYHSVKNEEMRNHITNSMKNIDSDFNEVSKLLNGKNILILDDSISRGQSISDAVKVIGELYVPKSFTVLTMFSKSYEK